VIERFRSAASMNYKAVLLCTSYRLPHSLCRNWGPPL